MPIGSGAYGYSKITDYRMWFADRGENTSSPLLMTLNQRFHGLIRIQDSTYLKEPLMARTELEGSHVDFVAHVVVAEDRCADYERFQPRFQEAARSMTGYQRSEVKRLDGGPEGCQAYAVMHRFDTPGDLITWLESKQRRNVVRDIHEELGDDLHVEFPNEIAGFSSWFVDPKSTGSSRKPPVVWKQSLLILLLLYPLTILVSWVAVEVVPDVSVSSIRLFSTAVVVAAMGYFLVPLGTRILRPWMDATAPMPQILGAAGLVLILALLWLLVHLLIDTPAKDLVDHSDSTSSARAPSLESDLGVTFSESRKALVGLTEDHSLC